MTHAHMPDLQSDSDGANGAPGSPRQANGVPVRQKMRRKQSSPMMPPFMVSAPGKVIVFGEHAVVHGKVSALSIRPLEVLGARLALCDRPGEARRAEQRKTEN